MATAFSTFDADGAFLPLPAGEPFQTFWVVEDGEAVPEVISHAWTALDQYDAETRARFRIVATTVPDPRRELPKSLVMSRVFGLGKAAAVQALFNANFQLQAQWFSPDWPNVYADDAGLLAALAGFGLTTDEIVQVTA